MHDADLLRDYVKNGSEAAFATLVKRHIDLVYSTARRQVRDEHLAQDIAQTVFCLLVRKAGSLGGQPALAGWLYRATCFTAARTMRGEQRRHRREQEAVEMNQPDLTAEKTWEHLAPLLDEALNQLREKDRLAVLLRFFQRKPMREVGEELGVNEAAAKMRVGRAVEQLREFFAKRGVACSSATLGVLLTEKAAEAAPAAVTSGITTAVLSGTAATVSALSSIQILILMTRLKAKTLIVAGIGALAVLSVSLQRYYSVQHRNEPVQITTDSSANPIPASATRDPDGVARQRARSRAVTRASQSLATIDLGQAISDLRAALHLARPQSGVKSYPSEEVLRALLRFGPNRKEAFPILKEAANDPDSEVRKLAVSAMGFVGTPARPEVGFWGEPAPETADFLWNVLLGKNNELRDLALSSLRSIGFKPTDIPDLADLLVRSHGGQVSPDEIAEALSVSRAHGQSLLDSRANNEQLKRYIPVAIADTIQRNPDVTTYIPTVEGLLNNPKTDVRFGAACALAKYEATNNSKIFEELSAGLNSKDPLKPLMALETLQSLGPTAEPMIQVVSNYALTSKNNFMREIAFKTLGKINSELRKEFPEVDQALKKDEELAARNEESRLRAQSAHDSNTN